jgi:hypothetical protein
MKCVHRVGGINVYELQLIIQLSGTAAGHVQSSSLMDLPISVVKGVAKVKHG